jgi:hypothetical protein
VRLASATLQARERGEFSTVTVKFAASSQSAIGSPA